MKRTLLSVVLLMFLAVSAFAQITPAPSRMDFQGRLAKPDGTPVPDANNVQITLRLFASSSGGSALWAQTFNNISIRNGVFAIHMDFTTGFTGMNTLDTTFNNTPYLEIQVGSDPALTPRQQMGSNAFAFKANTVPDNAITSAKIADSAVLTQKILDLAVTAAKLGNLAVLTAKLADLAVTAVKLADGAVTTPKIADGAVTLPKLGSDVGVVPPGYHILGNTPTSPTGYTYSGFAVSTESGNFWTTRSSPLSGRSYCAVAVFNNKIYVFGGANAGILGETWEYDPANGPNGTWTQKTSMPTPRGGAAAAVVNNKIYVIGGFNGPNVYLTKNEEYDPATDMWATKAPMPTGRDILGAAAVNNKIYAIGGRAVASSNKNEEYAPATDMWTTKAPMLTARSFLAVVAVNNRVYALGGYNSSNPGISNKNEEYDPATNTWATKSSSGFAARTNVAAAVLNNRIYVVGGSINGTNALSKNEEYNPATDAWAIKADLSTPRATPGVAAVNGKMYAIGGYDGSTYFGTNEEYTPVILLYVHTRN